MAAATDCGGDPAAGSPAELGAEVGKTALLFPGQGSQTADMRATVERQRPDLLELARSEVGDDPFARVDDGTAYAQPAIYCASIAGWTGLGEPAAELLAGHSLGELGALAAAGAVSAEDGLRIVALRGRLMQEAGEADPGGGMIVLRADAEQAAPIAERAGLSVANDNSPQQVALSGSSEALDAGIEAAEADGIRAKRLPVAGAFHSPAMEAAVPRLEAALAEIEIREPSATVLSAVTAAPFDDVRKRIAEGVVKPVRWRETLLALGEHGGTRFLEVGPGKVLTGLVRKTLGGDVEALTAADVEPAHA